MNGALFLFCFSGITVQTLLFRELLVVFQGNELATGLMFAQWLLGIAAGKLLMHRNGCENARKINGQRGLFLILFALFAAGGLAVVRTVPALLPALSGDGIPLRSLLILSLIVVFPASLWPGVVFNRPAGDTDAGGRRYLSGALGVLAGGAVTTFIFIPLANAATAVCVIAAAHCLAAAFLFYSPITRSLSLAAAILFIGVLPFSPSLDRLSTASLYGGYQVKEFFDSPYARITRAGKNGEDHHFYGGIPFRFFPAPHTVSTEASGHVPLLLHSRPRAVLLLGGGKRFIPLFLNHEIETLDYIDIDPLYTGFAYSRDPGSVRFQPDDPRLHIHAVDARAFLRSSRKKYDVISIGMPPPVNLLFNRYFTDEFFQLLKNRLAHAGIGTISLPGSLVYADSAMAELNDTIITTLRRSFRFVRVIPGEQNIIVFSPQPSVPFKTVRDRFIARKIPATFLSAQVLSRMDDPEIFRWFRFEMRKCQTESRVNRDFHPQGMLAALVYRHSLIAPRAAVAYRFMVRHAWAISLCAFLLLVLIVRRETSITAVSSGFCAMVLLLLNLWGFQAANGSLYLMMGLLSACFMGGWGTGAWIAHSDKIRAEQSILAAEVFFLFWTGTGWAGTLAAPGMGWFYFVFLFVTGSAAGFEFHLLEKLSGSSPAQAVNTSLLGLAGGWVAAGIGGTMLIPALGVRDTFLFIAALKTIGLFRWVR